MVWRCCRVCGLSRYFGMCRYCRVCGLCRYCGLCGCRRVGRCCRMCGLCRCCRIVRLFFLLHVVAYSGPFSVIVRLRVFCTTLL